MALGRKGRDAFRKQRWTIAGEYVDIGARVQAERAAEIARASDASVTRPAKWTRSTSCSTSSRA